ncbi:SMR family transporter [Conexibacter sp. JD483]|uniref:DMT family transporter n=1 Tax=unclassified Conexibacter TaxID=2627773 RepID=UPI00272518BD|nr:MULTISPECIES: SMR family transporter [unclassified Conexibacter]MDO8188328.1 SMR family transporter [Conexibacter sp. CPCC 205706]MDO8200724.1 SMR family transporter [Conexibacter sp. CPCC 205762]MDR9369448.1 SMR family transporter [Conexibacter sp. JD483]
MTWVVLVLAGLCEVVWAIGMKQSHGFTRLLPSLVFLAGAASSTVLLAIAMRSLPAGTAYAVWAGIGAVGTAGVGIAALSEPAHASRFAALGLIVAGILWLAVSDGS